jgi:hypothetical protein
MNHIASNFGNIHKSRKQKNLKYLVSLLEISQIFFFFWRFPSFVWQGPICQAEHIIIMCTHSFGHKLSVECLFLFNFVMLLKG